MDEFQLRVENLLEKHDLTKKEVSKLLGYSENRFGQMIKNGAKPNFETLIRLSEIFNVTLDYLMNGKEFQPNKEDVMSMEKVNELLRIFEQHNIEKPFILDITNWSRLDEYNLHSLQNYFYFLLSEEK